MKYVVREKMYRKQTVYEVSLTFPDTNQTRFVARYHLEEVANDVTEALNNGLLYEVE